MSDSDFLSGLGIEPYETAAAQAARLSAIYAMKDIAHFSFAGVDYAPFVSALTLEPFRRTHAPTVSYQFAIQPAASDEPWLRRCMESGTPFLYNGLEAYVRGERWERGRVLFQIEVRA